ncbi:MAG: DHHA1 domain-containing protein, partial [Campylobacterales bacterium]|nr:DHHA1 domain-containing protein [Campylobacterales bacterium]
AEVVWYFMAALKIELGVNDNLKEYLDLVAIATIADVMPLRDINRVIVKAGIDVIKTSKRPAIATMRSKLGKTEFSSTDIAYKISPRLNSAGRLVLAKEAFSFLRAKSVEEASIFFDKLDSLNEERKKIELSVYEEAMTTVDKDADIIVVAKEGWHEGVVGIVASRLAQHFKKPSIVFSIEGQNAKGSARSIGNINIFELISKSASLLSNFGGHKMAAGVSLNAANIDAFRALINETARGYTPSGECVCKECVGEVPFCDIDDELANILDRFEPYGEANEKPVFFGSAKTVAEFKTIGAGKGFKMTLVDDEGTDVRAVCFRTSNTPKNGDKINLRFSVYKNDFFGGSVELMVEEIVAS